MNLQRINTMLDKMHVSDKEKKKLIITFLESATDLEMDAAKAIGEGHGWTVVEVKVDPAPCQGIAIQAKYINPEDEPQMEPGHIYA